MAEPDPEKEIEVAYELPDGWMWVRLSDVINDFQPGFACGARDDHGYVQLRMNNIGLDGCVVLEKTLRVPIEKTNIEKYNLRIGDILFNNTNSVELIGKTALFRDEVQNCAFSNHITRIRPDTRLINSKYLLNVFINDYNNGIFRMMCHRFVGQAGISRKKLLEHTFPLPPHPEQHRIVTKLETLLSQVDRSKYHLAKVPLLIKRFRQSVLAAACSGRLTEDWRRKHPDVEHASELLNKIREERIRRYAEECQKAEAEGRRKPKKPKNLEPQVVDAEGLPELPGGWVWTTIGAVSERIHYGYTEKASNEPIGPKFLRITDIQNNNVNWDSVPYCKIKEEEKKKYLLSEGDLVFARTGATVGKSFIINEKIPEAVFASYLIRIILDASVDKMYISQFFHSHFYWLQIHEGEIGIGQPNVNSEKLSKIVFPFPSFAEQQIIVQRLETLFHFADEVEQRVAAATTHANHLTQSILARAFRGELVPQDPRDEPASVLLERIKQERAELKEKKKTQKGISKTMLDFN